MAAKRCDHPASQKTQVDEYYVHCGKCGRTFVPRDVPTPHGTYRGYCRHQKKRTGEWMWPIPEDDACGCRAAQVAWRTEYHGRESTKEKRRKRNCARFAALVRLQRTYPGAYARFYTEELAIRNGRPPVRQKYEVPVWDDVLARLVKAATGSDEMEIAERVRGRFSTDREREVTRLVSRLRIMLRDLSR